MRTALAFLVAFALTACSSPSTQEPGKDVAEEARSDDGFSTEEVTPVEVREADAAPDLFELRLPEAVE